MRRAGELAAGCRTAIPQQGVRHRTNVVLHPVRMVKLGHNGFAIKPRAA